MGHEEIRKNTKKLIKTKKQDERTSQYQNDLMPELNTKKYLEKQNDEEKVTKLLSAVKKKD